MWFPFLNESKESHIWAEVSPVTTIPESPASHFPITLHIPSFQVSLSHRLFPVQCLWLPVSDFFLLLLLHEKWGETSQLYSVIYPYQFFLFKLK